MKHVNELMYNVFNNLNNVYRFSNTSLIHSETTAEHTMRMQLLALYFYNKSAGLNISDLIMRILFHDLDEMVLCDIPRDIKYYNEESYAIINEVYKKKFKDIGILSDIQRRIDNAKHDGSLNGALCQVIDVLQCTLKLYDEYQLQNNSYIKDKLQDSICNLKNSLDEYSDRIAYFADNENTIGRSAEGESVVSHKDTYDEIYAAYKELNTFMGHAVLEDTDPIPYIV